jgi:hypothetical protein
LDAEIARRKELEQRTREVFRKAMQDAGVDTKHVSDEIPPCSIHIYRPETRTPGAFLETVHDTSHTERYCIDWAVARARCYQTRLAINDANLESSLRDTRIKHEESTKRIERMHEETHFRGEMEREESDFRRQMDREQSDFKWKMEGEKRDFRMHRLREGEDDKALLLEKENEFEVRLKEKENDLKVRLKKMENDFKIQRQKKENDFKVRMMEKEFLDNQEIAQMRMEKKSAFDLVQETGASALLRAKEWCELSERARSIDLRHRYSWFWWW